MSHTHTHHRPHTDPASPWYDELQATYYWQNGLYVFNLNDLGGCFIVLVELLIDSSLIQPFADALTAATPRASRRPFISIYFIVYYVIGQLVLLNVLVAFILDEFMSAQEKDKGSKEEEEQAGESKGAAAAGDAGVN